MRPVKCLGRSSSAGSRSALLRRLLKGGQTGFVGEILVEIYVGHLEDRLKRGQGKSGGESAVVRFPSLRKTRRRCERRRAPDLTKDQRPRRSISGRLERFTQQLESIEVHLVAICEGRRSLKIVARGSMSFDSKAEIRPTSYVSEIRVASRAAAVRQDQAAEMFVCLYSGCDQRWYRWCRDVERVCLPSCFVVGPASATEVAALNPLYKPCSVDATAGLGAYSPLKAPKFQYLFTSVLRISIHTTLILHLKLTKQELLDSNVDPRLLSVLLLELKLPARGRAASSVLLADKCLLRIV